MAGEIPLIRMEQGATELSVPSSCYINIESGGYIAVDDGGYITYPVVADTSSANLANFGVSSFNVDSSAPTTFTLDAPAAGVHKYLYCDDGASATGLGYVSAGVPIASSASSTNSFLKFDTVDSRAELVGLSTSKWLLLFKSTGVTISTGPA